MKNGLWFALLVVIVNCLSSNMEAQSTGGNYFEAFLSVENDASLIPHLEFLGMEIYAKYDGFLIARIDGNENEMPQYTISGVKHITPASKLVTCSDSARYYSNVDVVHQGEGFSSPYTGKDVIIGVIDCGFDFNHINLCDGNGNTRVKAVYLPLDNSGVSPVVGGFKLPGSCYEDAAAIKQLTTDDANTTHGTQTAGIAAGSYRDNGWYGMAPDADIVACGMPEDDITDVRVANCIAYIFDYAKRAGKPCVINISLGSNTGPHDDTSFLTRVFDQVSGPGRIIVVSAGNDGNNRVCLHRDIAGEGDVATALLSGYGYGIDYSGTMKAWSKTRTPFGSRLVIVNVQNGDVVYESDAVYTNNEGLLEISGSSDLDFGLFFEGSVSLKGTLEADNRYSMSCNMNLRAKSTEYTLGIQYFANSPVSLTAWTSQYAFIDNHGISWAESGSSSGSISDLATTDSVISVGSYNTREFVPLRNGTTYDRTSSKPMVLSYYSAYGPDENGIRRPDVCAPGSVMIASANRYDTKAPNIAYWQPSVFFNGVEYPYCPDLGTSMSAPVVAGAVALWLEANPELSTADVRNILVHSSDKDSQVASGNPQRWGNGKLDVAAGLRYLLNPSQKPGDLNLDGSVNLSDINILINILLGGKADESMRLRADVNGDGNVNISDLNVIIGIILSN